MLHFKGKSNIIFYFHIGIKGVILEYHGNIAVLWRNLVHSPAVHNDLSAAYTLKSCNHAQQRCLSAAGRAYKYYKFPSLYFHIHILNSMNIARIPFIHFAYLQIACKIPVFHILIPCVNLSFRKI